MKKTKKLAAACLMLATVAALSACGSGGNSNSTAAGASSSPGSEAPKQEQVELRVMWWGDQARADITTAMFKKFEEKHPEIKIVPEFSPFDGYFDKLNTQIASGTAPDAFTLGNNILDYSLKNVLLDLNPYVGKELNVSDISPSLINFNTFNDKLFGISIGANSRAVMVNTEVLNKAGIEIPQNNWTWDDFTSVNEQVAKKLGKGYYGSYDYSGDYPSLENYLKQSDKVIYNKDKEQLGFTADDAKAWFSLWDQMRQVNGIVTPELQVSADPDDTSKSLVPQGKVAMQFVPTNQFGSYQEMTKDKLIMLPFPTGPNGNAVAIESSQNVVGYANTKHPKEVAELMDFWVNDPDAAQILGTNRGAPVSSKMRALLEQTASDTDKAVYNYLDVVAVNDVKPTYNIPGFNEFSQLLKTDSQNIAFGKSNPEKAAADFYDKGSKILETNLNTSN